MSGVITFHFDGRIVENHEISLRVLSNTLNGFQGAIDRAYLDLKYENVWKYARLKQEDYAQTEFIVGRPWDGGYFLDIKRGAGAAIVKRIHQAIDAVMESPWDDGATAIERLANQVATRSDQLDLGIYTGRTVVEYKANPGGQVLRKYGDRSIAKEVDQILQPIRNSKFGDEELDTLELKFEFDGEHEYTVAFDKHSAARFHSIVSERALGEPLLYEGILRSIDRGNRYAAPKAKLTLALSNRDIVVHIGTQEAYQALAPHMQGDQTVKLYACPILEFNTFDPNAGDVFFVRLGG